MFRVIRSRFLGIALAAAFTLSLFGFGSASAARLSREAVFTTTNAAVGNAVLAFNRAPDGSLTPAGSYSTGGLGTGVGLGSQGALALDEDGHRLFAVNAGSNEISVLGVGPDGLALLAKVPSGGIGPISLSVHGRLLYVLNAGTPNIAGFAIQPDGALSPIAGSTRTLSPSTLSAAEVAFSPDGNWLVVTEKGTSMLDTFAVDASGRAGAPVASLSHGATPFGFAFDKRGHVIVSEAGPGAVSSYAIAPDGSLQTITGSLIDTGQNAACWIAVAKNGRYAYAANAHSGTLTGFALAHDGSLSLLDANAISAAPGGTPLDMTFTQNGQYLYVFNAAMGVFNTYALQADGSLLSLGNMGSFPAGSAGIAAR